MKIIEIRAEINEIEKEKENWFFEKINTIDKLITSHPLGWLLLQKQTNKQNPQKNTKMTSVGEDVDKLEHVHRWWDGIVKWDNHYGK